MKPHIFRATEQTAMQLPFPTPRTDRSRPDMIRILETMVSYPESDLADAGTRPSEDPEGSFITPLPVILRLVLA